MTPEYWAGFFDGEGTVDLRFRHTHQGKYFRFEVRVQLVQVDLAPLLACQDQYGGSISKPKGMAASRLLLACEAAKAFLTDVAPYLIVKKKEAEYALQFFELVAAHPPKHRTVGKGFHLTAPEITAQKIVLFDAIRKVRADKGFCTTRRRAPKPHDLKCLKRS